MIPFLSLVTSVKDYIEIAHKLIESEGALSFPPGGQFTGETSFLGIKSYTELGSVLTYFILTMKELVTQFFSLSWIASFGPYTRENLWSLPIIVPDIASAMVSEISVLDGFFHNAFTFLEKPLSYGQQNLAIYGFEKFMIGFINSVFLILPTSASHIITLRRFVMQGIEAGSLSGLGTIAGNFLWLSSIIFGWRFFVIPWLSFDIFRYLLGFILLVKYMWDCSFFKERRMVLEDLSKWKIFLLNFLLALTEQTSIYPFISNLSIGPEASLLETFPLINSLPTIQDVTQGDLTQFIFIHGAYLLGILIGSLSLLQFTCWFWENPAFTIYMWMISSYRVTTSYYYKVLNFVFMYLTMLCAISSIPYFGLDYTVTNPLGFLPKDRLIDQKLSLLSSQKLGDNDKLIRETSFLGVKPTDSNMRVRDGVRSRRERWKERLIKYQAFDASTYDQGVFDFLTMEDLNYGFDRFWLRRKMRNHKINFRLFPGPWMRSVKKQLNKPGFTGPRTEFFRLLFEQYYHPSFHRILNQTSKKNLAVGLLSSFVATEGKPTLPVTAGRKANPPVSFASEGPKESKSTQLPEVGKENKNAFFRSKQEESLNQKVWGKKTPDEILNSSALRKFIRNMNNRIKTAEINTGLNSPNKGFYFPPIPLLQDLPSSLITRFNGQRNLISGVPSDNFEASLKKGLLNTLENKPIYSKRWKHLYSKISHQILPAKNRQQATFFRNVSRKILLGQPNAKQVLEIENKSLLDAQKLGLFGLTSLESNFLNKGTSESKLFVVPPLLPEVSKGLFRIPEGSKPTTVAKTMARTKLSKKDRQILKYRTFLLKKESSLDKIKMPSSSLSLEKKPNIAPTKALVLEKKFKDANLFKAQTMLHPLKYYLQKEEAFRRKLKFYGTKVSRKFSVGKNASYFRTIMKRAFYYYKPSLRLKRTTFIAAMRRGFRKKSRIPRKRDSFSAPFALPTVAERTESFPSVPSWKKNALPTSLVEGTFSKANPTNVPNPAKIKTPTHSYSVLGKRASRYRSQIYRDVLQHWYYTPFNRLLLKFDIDAFINRQPKSHFLTKQEEHFLHLKRFLLSEHYDTLRWYTYMQHYRSMKNRIGGTKSLSSRPYNQQFQGTFKKIRHLFAITLNKNSLALASQLEVKASQPEVKAVAKVDWLGSKATTPVSEATPLPKVGFATLAKQTTSLVGSKANREERVVLPSVATKLDKSKEIQNSSFNLLLKFDQPLYNEFNNSSKKSIMQTSVFHEELFPTEGIVVTEPTRPSGFARVGSFAGVGSEAKPSVATKLATTPGSGATPSDLVAQSSNIVGQYLSDATPIRKELIKQFIEEKNYSELTQFLYKGEKTRGSKAILNNKDYLDQEKNFLVTLLPPVAEQEKQKIQLLPSVSQQVREKIEKLIIEGNIEQELWVKLLKESKRRVNDQVFIKNYITHRIEKREQRTQEKEKELKKRLQRIRQWLAPISLQNLASIQESGGFRTTKSLVTSSSLVATEGFAFPPGSEANPPRSEANPPRSEAMLPTLANSAKPPKAEQFEVTTGLQKALNDSLTSLNDQSLTTDLFMDPAAVWAAVPIGPKNLVRVEKEIFASLQSITEKKRLSASTGVASTGFVPKEAFILLETKQAGGKSKSSKKIGATVGRTATLTKINKWSGLEILTKSLKSTLKTVSKPLFNILNTRTKKDLGWWRKKQRVMTKRKNSRKKNRFKKLTKTINRIKFDKNEAKALLSEKNAFFSIPGTLQKESDLDLTDARPKVLLTSGSKERNRIEIFRKKKINNSDFLPSVDQQVKNNSFTEKQNTQFSTLLKSYSSKDSSLPLVGFPTFGKDLLRYQATMVENMKTPRFFKRFSKKLSRKGRRYRATSIGLHSFIRKAKFLDKDKISKKKKLSTINSNIKDSSQNFNKILKKSRVKKRVKRVWRKHKRQKYTQKRNKYRKRRIHSAGKIRVLNKKLKRLKSSLQLQKWWWQTFLPTFQSSYELTKSSALKPNQSVYPPSFETGGNPFPSWGSQANNEVGKGPNSNLPNSQWQLEKEREIDNILSKLFMEKKDNNEIAFDSTSKETFSLESLSTNKKYNFLTIGNQDFKPLALPLDSAKPSNNSQRSWVTSSLPLRGRSWVTSGSKGTEATNSLGKKENILNKVYKNLFSVDAAQKGPLLERNFVEITNPVPFYAGWDESLRKFVVTNRLLSRRDAGFVVQTQKIPSLDFAFSTRYEQKGKALLGTKTEVSKRQIEFSKAPIQGLNDGSFLYWQTEMPFNTYTLDQFNRSVHSFYAPIGWRRFQFRHSILKTWLNYSFASSLSKLEEGYKKNSSFSTLNEANTKNRAQEKSSLVIKVGSFVSSEANPPGSEGLASEAKLPTLPVITSGSKGFAISGSEANSTNEVGKVSFARVGSFVAEPTPAKPSVATKLPPVAKLGTDDLLGIKTSGNVYFIATPTVGKTTLVTNKSDQSRKTFDLLFRSIKSHKLSGFDGSSILGNNERRVAEKNRNRRIKKRYRVLKQFPFSVFYMPTGPLLTEVLPSHYLSVFDIQYRYPRHRYLKTRLISGQIVASKGKKQKISSLEQKPEVSSIKNEPSIAVGMQNNTADKTTNFLTFASPEGLLRKQGNQNETQGKKVLEEKTILSSLQEQALFETGDSSSKPTGKKESKRSRKEPSSSIFEYNNMVLKTPEKILTGLHSDNVNSKTGFVAERTLSKQILEEQTTSLDSLASHPFATGGKQGNENKRIPLLSEAKPPVAKRFAPLGPEEKLTVSRPTIKDFTLRKRIKPKRKYHRKRNLSRGGIVFPRRRKFFLTVNKKQEISSLEEKYLSETFNNGFDAPLFSSNKGFLRWRPGKGTTLKRISNKIIEPKQSKSTLRIASLPYAEQGKGRRRARKRVKTSPSRLRQLRRREFQQILKPTQRFHPRYGGFAWPGDYLQLEGTDMPKLFFPQDVPVSKNSLLVGREEEPQSLTKLTRNQKSNSQIRSKKRKIDPPPVSVLPRKYLLQKHNIRALKKKLENAYRSNKIAQRIKELKILI